ncbi:hypothetical protein P152DRAFT_409032 [Eremomyces bilateralis CBS 781.70]|uniref:Uncharacterized protein n=1 Tax=Eremomyces bilateralis CBS 781.70 TaxID=1392243 RepID=A0A6G1GE15_9PEZI|nr:uncharacterized protein P152DRAFT_409032 [Eremomyces bilateralis CBS 781.70]KAF1816272.1 hypothetical protein P152DRAFT_409032 [Eremomyces bilateralis CBS 781.70]
MPRPEEDTEIHRSQGRFYIGIPAIFFPFYGIIFFCTHSFLWPLLKARLIPCLLLTLFVLFNLFFWTYLPQVAFLAIWHGPAAWANGTILVLGEGAVITALLFEAFLVDETQVDIFDSILVYKGLEDLVSTTRPILVDESDPRKRLGKPFRSSNYAPFSFRQIIEFMFLLPLNLIPIVGIPLFLLGTGWRAGPLQHWRYFRLSGFDRKARNAFIKRHRWQYTWFGTVYLTLQLVPALSMLFLLTTAAGSALWAASLEDRKREVENRSQEPPDYVDAP